MNNSKEPDARTLLVAAEEKAIREELIYAILIKYLPKDATLDNMYQDLKEVHK